MDPEKGDRNIKVHRSDVVAACVEVGIGAGDLVMFHSSLSSMGDVVGGPNTIIDGLLEAVGPTGTVCAPTLWWNGAQDLSEWDPDTSPSYPGIITEAFRQRPESIRSNNPTHSVSAIGPRAAELTANHGDWGLRACMFGDKAFAAASPWERLYLWNAHYCFIGVDFTVNTMAHYCQAVFVEQMINQAPPERREELDRRISRMDDVIEYYRQSNAGETPTVIFAWPLFDFRLMGERLAEMGLVRFSHIGSATFRAICARDMVDTILDILRTEPEQWLPKDFLAWLEDSQRA